MALFSTMDKVAVTVESVIMNDVMHASVCMNRPILENPNNIQQYLFLIFQNDSLDFKKFEFLRSQEINIAR